MVLSILCMIYFRKRPKKTGGRRWVMSYTTKKR